MIFESKLLKRAGKTLTLWHGGNLDSIVDIPNSARSGRAEFGPGLYLTTNWQTAQRYSKGSRKLYRITVEEGNDARTTILPIDAVTDFVKQNVIKSKQKDVMSTVDLYKDRYTADYLINSIINNEAMPTSRYPLLQRFLVEQGVDYLIVPNAFGWGETMLVLFNVRKIVKKEVITPKTKIDTFDLPTEFSENV